jgi:hypothetical protein
VVERANITPEEFARAADDLISELTGEQIACLPGVRDAILVAISDAVIERARERRVEEHGHVPPGDDNPDMGSTDYVHRLIPGQESRPNMTACGAAPDSDGGADVDPALVTCPECRALAEGLPRTRTRERRRRVKTGGGEGE